MANVHTFDGSHKVRALIPPAAQGSLNSAWVSPFATSGVAGDAERAVFFLLAGTLDADDTVDVEVWRAKNASGGSPELIPGALLTQVTDENDEALKSIEIGPGAMSDAEGFTHVQVRVTVANGTPIWGVFQVNHRLRYPGTGGQHASYDEQVIVLG